jgi:predicted MFS family arabinose efflux permease
MAAFAVAAAVGPLLGGLLVDQVSWRWVFYVNLPVGALAMAGLHLRLPSVEVQAPRTPLDLPGAALLSAGTIALMLACILAPTQPYGWGSPAIVALLAASGVLGVALIARTRRTEDPIVPLSVIGNRPVALASAALFLVTATMFSITVFVPVFLQTTTGASPTQAGLLLIPMMVGITLSTNVAGRLIQRTGRYKLFPVVGLAWISAALLALAVLVEHPSRITIGIALTLFGLGFGMVGQVLIIAVQNSVGGRDLGLAMAVTGFFRALGGAVGAAALGAVFASRVGHAGTGTLALAHAGRIHVVSGVHDVFLVTAPTALVALVVVLALREVPLRGPSGPARPAGPEPQGAGQPATAGATR